MTKLCINGWWTADFLYVLDEEFMRELQIPDYLVIPSNQIRLFNKPIGQGENVYLYTFVFKQNHWWSLMQVNLVLYTRLSWLIGMKKDYHSLLQWRLWKVLQTVLKGCSKISHLYIQQRNTVNTQTYAHTYTYTHTHTHAYRRVNTHMCTHAQAPTCKHAQTCYRYAHNINHFVLAIKIKLLGNVDCSGDEPSLHSTET